MTADCSAVIHYHETSKPIDYSSNDDDDHIHINDVHIHEKFRKIQFLISNELQNANVLWSVDASFNLHLGYLPYLVTMAMINKSNNRLTLISGIHNYFNNSFTVYNPKMISYYDTFKKFNIGTIMKFNDIYYRTDYQNSFFHVTNSIKIVEVIECLRKKIQIPVEINDEPTSNLISILLILNNIIYFNISHVLIGEHEMPFYELIKTLLLDKYDRTLNILNIPMFLDLSKNELNSRSWEKIQISLDVSSSQLYDQLSYLEFRQKAMIFDYFNAMNSLFSTEKMSFQTDTNLVDIIENIRKRILLSSILHNNCPTYVAVSFLTDQFHILRKHWKKYANKIDKCTGTGKSLDGIDGNREGHEPPLGGKFIIINWFNKEIVYQLDLDAPAGFFIDFNHLYIANNRLNYISIIDLKTRLEIRRINNRAFNCLHSIHLVEDQTILVTSTGIDAIIETNLQGETLNDWYATEHDYTLTPKGEQRNVSRDINHQHFIYPTLNQTTHINSAIILDEQHFLATLFHQGLLVRIDRRSGKSKILLSSLKCPHGIKRFKSVTENEIEWMLCNTKRNEILFLNNSFTIVRKMSFEDVNWLQDVSQIQNGHIIIADANNSRIIEIDPVLNTVTSEFSYSSDWRIYQISDLNEFKTSFIPFQHE